MAIIRANNNTLSSVTALPSAISTGSNIIETIQSPCDGRSVTVPSGTYTMPNVTAVQNLTTSYADVTGSSFAYTPPSDATRVLYGLSLYFARSDDYPLAHFKFFVDSDEAEKVRRNIYGNQLRHYVEFNYIIEIGGTADTTLPRVASWTSNKTMKIQAREYSGTYEASLHALVEWDGTSASGSGAGKVYVPPFLKIMALKDS